MVVLFEIIQGQYQQRQQNRMYQREQNQQRWQSRTYRRGQNIYSVTQDDYYTGV